MQKNSTTLLSIINLVLWQCDGTFETLVKPDYKTLNYSYYNIAG